MEEEVWRAIPSHPDYQASNLGRIASKRGHRNLPFVIMQPQKSRGAYHSVLLRDVNGKGEKRLVHRLVLETFIGPRPDGMECCHNNGVPTDNRLENLRWDTRKANGQDRIVHGTSGKGELNPFSRLTSQQATEIREAVAAGEMRVDVARRYGVTAPLVSQIVLGKAWAHAGGPRLTPNALRRRSDRQDNKLTADMVRAIRAERAAGALNRELAEKYGVSQPNITNIVLRKLWKHVA